MILVDLGADVLKIEIPGKGDGSREMPPHFVHGQSGYFLSMNRSKKSMTLDLKRPAGLEIFYELVRRSDVVYDNFRPGILERPRIWSCSCTPPLITTNLPRPPLHGPKSLG